jgi:hypothetical protein
MIFELFIIGIFLFVITPAVYRAGRAKPRIEILKHVHIWSPWETTSIRVVKNHIFLYETRGQKRNCLDCNYEQSEVIKA